MGQLLWRIFQYLLEKKVSLVSIPPHNASSSRVDERNKVGWSPNIGNERKKIFVLRSGGKVDQLKRALLKLQHLKRENLGENDLLMH